MKKYKIEAGFWISCYKRIDFVVESENEPKIIDEHSLINLLESNVGILREEIDTTTEEVDWADLENYKIEKEI